MLFPNGSSRLLPNGFSEAFVVVVVVVVVVVE